MAVSHTCHRSKTDRTTEPTSCTATCCSDKQWKKHCVTRRYVRKNTQELWPDNYYTERKHAVIFARHALKVCLAFVSGTDHLVTNALLSYELFIYLLLDIFILYFDLSNSCFCINLTKMISNIGLNGLKLYHGVPQTLKYRNGFRLPTAPIRKAGDEALDNDSVAFVSDNNALL